MRLYTGTSGFSYDSWKGPFYPDDLPAAEMLAYYAGRLPAVEINNTFYRMPKRSMLAKWAASVPDGFRFVIKASRRITHIARLKEAEEPVGYLLQAVAELGDRQGPILLQLPPYLRKDVPRLRAFLAGWSPEVRAAFEFRHASWIDDEVHGVLREANAAFCWADTGEGEAPLVATADWGYLRLRRPGYARADLEAWAGRIREQPWGEAFAFFKHEEAGAGPRLAQEFAALFAGGG